jgi:hypothetical protein
VKGWNGEKLSGACLAVTTQPHSCPYSVSSLNSRFDGERIHNPHPDPHPHPAPPYPTITHLEDGLVAVVAHGGVVVHLEALQVLHQAALQVACAPGARQGRTSVGSRRHRASPAS